MNSLSKGIGVLLGISVLLIGNILLQEVQEVDNGETADRRVQTTPPVQQASNTTAMNSLEQELTTVRNRLAGLGNRQPEMSALHVRLADLEEAQRRLQAELVAQLDDRAVLEEHAGDTSLQSQEARQDREDALIAHFDAHFWREAKDPAWSHETEQILVQAMDTKLLEGSSLLAADCQTTLCQLEAGHNDDDARDVFMSNFLTQVPYDTQVFYYHIAEGDGLSRTVMYLARAGHELPPLDQE